MNRIVTAILFLSLSFSPAFAQGFLKKAGKAATQVTKGAKKVYVPPQITAITPIPKTSVIVIPPQSEIVHDIERQVAKAYKVPANANHSIVPSGTTILGSDKNILPGTLSESTQIAQFLNEKSGGQYYHKVSREKLRRIIQNQSGIRPQNHKIKENLPHAVPAVTFNYITKAYEEVILLERALSKQYFPFLVRVINGEEWEPSLRPEEYNQFFMMVKEFIQKTDRLLEMLPTDPYLSGRKNFWQEALYQVSPPNVKSLLATPELERPNTRPYDAHEMFLQYADGKEAWPDGIPEDEITLVRDPDEELSDFQVRHMMRRDQALADKLYTTLPSVINEFYKAVFNQELAAPAQEQLAAAIVRNGSVEVEVNVPKFTIYVVNDDSLPLLNWKKLDKLPGIEVKTFRDGFSFMKAIKENTQPNLVIMDLLVGNGGKAIMEDFRAYNSSTPVIACSKWEPDQINAEELYEKNGFDGYMWNNHWANESILFPYYSLPALTNYFNMLKRGGWTR